MTTVPSITPSPTIPMSPYDKTENFPFFCLNYISTHDVDNLTNGELAAIFGIENSEYFLVEIASARSVRFARLYSAIKNKKISDHLKHLSAYELLAIIKDQT